MLAAAALCAAILSTSLFVFGVGAQGVKPKNKKPVPPAAKPAAASAAGSEVIALGKKVYDARGCATCHVIAGKGGNSGPDLTATGSSSTHTAEWLSVQVANPKAHNPDSTMPAFAQTIQGKELTAIGVYLASLKGSSSAPLMAAAYKGTPLNPAVVAKIEKIGGLIGPVAQNDGHIDVNLHLAGANANDAALTTLATVKDVVRLDLGQTAVTDAGLVHLKSMPGLQELHLEGTKVTDAGLTVVGGLKNLTYLNLYNTAITDAGLAKLTGLKSLRKLYVWQTKVTEEGTKKLKESLPKVEIIGGWDQSPAAAPKK